MKSQSWFRYGSKAEPLLKIKKNTHALLDAVALRTPHQRAALLELRTFMKDSPGEYLEVSAKFVSEESAIRRVI